MRADPGGANTLLREQGGYLLVSSLLADSGSTALELYTSNNNEVAVRMLGRRVTVMNGFLDHDGAALLLPPRRNDVLCRGVVAAAAVQERWCSSCTGWRSSCRCLRKARRYAVPLCVLYSIILATVMFDLRETTLLLAERVLLAAFVLLCSSLLSLPSTGIIRVGRWMWRRQWRVRPASSNTRSHIAVLINIQEYVHWPRVVDRSWGALCENMQSRSAPADVSWRIYISCHSQMMDNDPQFLPADARGWGDGVSLSWLVRQLDAVRPRNARFYIIVNGCLTDAGDLLTRKFLEALDRRPGSLEIEEIYNELHTSVWNARRNEDLRKRVDFAKYGGVDHPRITQAEEANKSLRLIAWTPFHSYPPEAKDMASQYFFFQGTLAALYSLPQQHDGP
ncbi:unnamed protein product [Symbiodinium microadriaticum]|nr:unnamed protein product [Symbiodinium microadriaticum]